MVVFQVGHFVHPTQRCVEPERNLNFRGGGIAQSQWKDKEWMQIERDKLFSHYLWLVRKT